MQKKIIRFTLFVFITLWICGYGVFVLNVLNQKPETPDKITDAIIILTGGNHRIKTGLTLFASGLSPNVFITGVHPSVTNADIEAMWNDASADLPQCCIILGHEATTTRENAIEVKKWIIQNHINSIRLVTSAYHIDRAMLEFTSALNATNIIPHPVEEPDYSTKDYKFWQLTFAEYNKILFRRIALLIPYKG